MSQMYPTTKQAKEGPSSAASQALCLPGGPKGTKGRGERLLLLTGTRDARPAAGDSTPARQRRPLAPQGCPRAPARDSALSAGSSPPAGGGPGAGRGGRQRRGGAGRQARRSGAERGGSRRTRWPLLQRRWRRGDGRRWRRPGASGCWRRRALRPPPCAAAEGAGGRCGGSPARVVMFHTMC